MSSKFLPPKEIESDGSLAFHAVLNQFIISRMLLTQGGLSVLKMYQGDALMHLRKAIEMCAFGIRINKHPELARTWVEAGKDLDKDWKKLKYKAYRDAFATKLVFPAKGHPDFDPAVADLKHIWELCSKPVHGSIFGVASYLANFPRGQKGQMGEFFDLEDDFLQSLFFYTLCTHLTILKLLGAVIESYMDDPAPWRKELQYADHKLDRHLRKWIPSIKALGSARKEKANRIAKVPESADSK
ncbi:MAG: hypothetical protein ABI972_03580 [Acidobacteriota bacterium]